MGISFKAPSNVVKFKVKGSVKDGAGVDQPFSFELEARRISQDEIQSLVRKIEEPEDVMAELIIGWAGVKDGTAEIEYSPDNFHALCREYIGLSRLVFDTYLFEVRAKAKN